LDNKVFDIIDTRCNYEDLQHSFISPSSFVPKCDCIQNSTVTNGLQCQEQVVFLFAVVVNFPSQLQECTACQGDQIKKCNF